MDAFDDLRHQVMTRLYGEEPPLTTTQRSSGFSEEDEAFRITVWHYNYQGTRSDFWLKQDTATKRLRDKVFGIVQPTPRQTAQAVGILDMGVSPLYRSHRQANTRQNQKKWRKRRKQIAKRHRR